MKAKGFRVTRPETTVEHVLKDTNPHYKDVPLYRGQWSQNCQRCCPAAEMIRRGYNVTVKPLPKNSDYLNDPLRYGRWWEAFEGGTRITWGGRVGVIKQQMKDWCDGARAEISIKWKGRRGSGHVFLCEQINGETVFYDAQTGRRGQEVESYFSYCYTRGVYANMQTFMRIDNLKPSDRMFDCIQKKDDPK